MKQAISKNILWVIYSIPIVYFGIKSLKKILFSLNSESLIDSPIAVFRLIDLVLSSIALVPLVLLILEIPTLTKNIWLLFGIIYVLWDFGFNLILKPIVLGFSFEWYVLIFPILFIPWYFALFLYSRICSNSS